MGKKMNSVLPRLASCIQGVRSVAPYCIVGMLCGLTLCGEAAALRFHSNNSAVSSGVWMTTLDKVPRYLFTSDGDIPVDNIRSFDTNPYVITSFERGKDIPSVCVRIETSDMGNLTNLKVSYALETAHGTYAYEMQKKVNYHVCCGYLD